MCVGPGRGASALAPPLLEQNRGGPRIAWKTVSKPLMQQHLISVSPSLSSIQMWSHLGWAAPSAGKALARDWFPNTVRSQLKCHCAGETFPPRSQEEPPLICPCVCVFSHSVVSDYLQPHGPQPGRLLLSMGFSKQNTRVLPFPSPGDLLDAEIEPGSPCIAGRFFTI